MAAFNGPIFLQVLGSNTRPLHPLENVQDHRYYDRHDLVHLRDGQPRPPVRLEGFELRVPSQRRESLHRKSRFPVILLLLKLEAVKGWDFSPKATYAFKSEKCL